MEKRKLHNVLDDRSSKVYKGELGSDHKTLRELSDINKDKHISHVDEDVNLELKFKKKVLAKKTLTPLNLTSEEFIVNESKIQASTPSKKIDNAKVETPISALGTDLEISTLLKNQDVFLGFHARDRWLEKLMQTIRNLCGGGKGFNLLNGSGEGMDQDIGDANKGYNSIKVEGDKECYEEHRKLLGEGDLSWPKVALTAIEIISTIERLNHESHKNDLHKYNLKMRQLDFNIKNNEVLAHRLLTKELEPITILNMSSIELKDGHITIQKEDQRPLEPEAIQMTNVRCSICTEQKVGVTDIIHVSYGDRYQLECLKCGNTWYSARDAVSSLRATNNTSNVH